MTDPPSLVSPPALHRRERLSPSVGVRGMPAAHLRPLPDEGQRLVVARRVSAVHRVSAAPHHQLLLQRKETLLQARLPTVSGRLFSTLPRPTTPPVPVPARRFLRLGSLASPVMAGFTINISY